MGARGAWLRGAPTEPVAFRPLEYRIEGDEPFQSSPHTSLLWALETLSWKRDYLADMARILSTLPRIDPGGQFAN